MDAYAVPGAAILVVDDDTAVRLMLAAVLTDEGYGITLAESMEAALVTLSQTPVDLVIAGTVVGHQGTLGAEAGVLLRAAGRTPVVLCTAAVLNPAAARAAGFSDCLRKPFDLDDFLARVAAALAVHLVDGGSRSQITTAFPSRRR